MPGSTSLLAGAVPYRCEPDQVIIAVRDRSGRSGRYRVPPPCQGGSRHRYGYQEKCKKDPLERPGGANATVRQFKTIAGFVVIASFALLSAGRRMAAASA